MIEKILIAEDDPASALLLQRALMRSGYAVSVAPNGREALQLLEREAFDALLTDWMMPELDGIELIRRVRTSIKPTPAIMLITALDSEQTRTCAVQAGADDYLTKPYQIQVILDRLGACLMRRAQPTPRRT